MRTGSLIFCVSGDVCACLFWGVNSLLTFQNFESNLALLVYFVKQIVISNIVFGFCVFYSIWEHRLNVFLNMFSNMSKNNICVNNFHTDHLFGEFLDFGSPYVAEASLASVRRLKIVF